MAFVSVSAFFGANELVSLDLLSSEGSRGELNVQTLWHWVHLSFYGQMHAHAESGKTWKKDAKKVLLTFRGIHLDIGSVGRSLKTSALFTNIGML